VFFSLVLFLCRSDYGPYLRAGIPAGGVFAGADKVKSEADRLRYQQATGFGGITGAALDPCYHQVVSRSYFLYVFVFISDRFVSLLTRSLFVIHSFSFCLVLLIAV